MNFIEEAINVYRTNKHIVVQKIGLKFDVEDDNVLYSFDIFYKRNKHRDKDMKAFLVVNQTSMACELRLQCIQEDM